MSCEVFYRTIAVCIRQVATGGGVWLAAGEESIQTIEMTENLTDFYQFYQ